MIFESVNKTRHALVADCDWTYCGFSAELAAQIHAQCFSTLKRPVQRIGFAHTPCPTTRPLEDRFYPNAMHIVRSVERTLDLPAMDLEDDRFYSWSHRFKGPF